MRRLWQGLNGWRRLLQEAAAASRRAANAGIVDERPAPIGVQLHPIRLGATEICLSVRASSVASAGHPGLRYVNLHENEQTSVAAARALLQHQPGTLIELRASGASPAAHAADHPVVALHNNGAGRYSVQAYAVGGAHAADAQAVAINPAWSPQDFLLVTTRGLFDGLDAHGFNVVLQSEQPVDDGSLAVWFQSQGRAYVNVEALYGHVQEQQRMLAAVAELARLRV